MSSTPVWIRVAAGEQLSNDVQDGFAFFTIILQVFGAIALLVGAFVISNTFAIRPSASIMNVVRATPQYFLPYIDFSCHTPYCSAME